jgi:hypothetical protein
MNRVLESWGPLVLAGPLTRLWSMQSVRGREPSAIVKMGIGCLLVAGAFLFMLGTNARRWKMARDMPPGARVCVAMTGRTILCSVERDRRLQRIGAMRPRCTQVQRILVGFLQSAFTDCLVCQCRSGAWHACPNRTGPSARYKQSVPVHRRTASSRCLLSANFISHPSGSHSSRRSGHVRCGCEESKEGVMPAQSLRILALLVAGVAPRLCWSLTTSIQHASGRLLHRSC